MNIIKGTLDYAGKFDPYGISGVIKAFLADSCISKEMISNPFDKKEIFIFDMNVYKKESISSK